MAGRLCRFVTLAFLLLYIAALGLLAVGTFGLFGAEKDPLSGVFLVPLGVPWAMMIDAAPDAAAPWLAMAAPALNLAIIAGICRLVNRPRA